MKKRGPNGGSRNNESTSSDAKSRCLANTNVSTPAITVRASKTLRNFSVLSPNTVVAIILPLIGLGLVAIVVTVYERYIADLSINEPVDLPLVMEEWKSPTRQELWSTYQPDTCIGLRPVTPTQSLSFGLAWFVQKEQGSIDLHHDCLNNHQYIHNHWSKHNGVSFGQQTIRSTEGYSITSEFISSSQSGNGHTWTIRVTGEPLKKMQGSYLSLILYVYNSGRGQMDMAGNIGKGMVEEIFGHTPEMKDYRIHFPYKFLTNNTVYSFMRTHIPSNEVNISNTLMKSLIRRPSVDTYPPLYTLTNNMATPTNQSINFIAYQITSLLIIPIEIDAVFESGLYSVALSFSGNRFTDISRIKHAAFDQKFENTFKLLSKGFKMEDVIMCKTVLSQVLSSIKYDYISDIRVKKDDSIGPQDYFSFPILASIGRQSSNDRNLWEYSIINEGYIQLLVLQWDPNITKSVIGSWLDTMNNNGWLPGHLPVGGGDILDTNVVSAPTLFLAMDTLLTSLETKGEMDYHYLRLVYTRLLNWFDWINTTQVGTIPGSYRWSQRIINSSYLNPETPSSGMGDYPRPSDSAHPAEYHLDLRCWLAMGLKTLIRIAKLLDEGDQLDVISHNGLLDSNYLDTLHWDNKHKVYSDYGYHNSNIKLLKNKLGELSARASGSPTLRYMGNIGYVSLYPMMFMLLSPDSPKLGYALKQLQDPMLLWSGFGIRSLSKNDYFYHKPNRLAGSGDVQYYYRGPVHIHINYLILRALHHYSNIAGPYADMAHKAYIALRANIIDTVVKEYTRTGLLWSHYNDKTGKGSGRTGSLSALILLIMSEIY